MSHRSYQARIPCSNKLLQKRWDESYYAEHRRRLRTTKPMVDTKPPLEHSHVVDKLKKKQLELERNQVIDRDNLTLLHKMQHIMKTEGVVDHRNDYKHHSLNDLKRQREVERVQHENESMLKRLQEVKPLYRVSDCIESWRKNAHLTEMITAYPQTTTSKQQMKKKSKLQSRPATVSGVVNGEIHTAVKELTLESSDPLIKPED